ncbi:MAG TPA: LptA/OstA family protein [Opitutaceae bacterium]|nr:LptA/OstA family protein [Opitutaceae bacterium]
MNRSALLVLCGLALAATSARAEDPAALSPTTIISQNLDMQTTDEESTFLFTGLVLVRGNNISLSCDRLEAITIRSQRDILKDEEKTALGQVGKFKRMLATGRVRIEQGDRVATCGRAEVLPGEEKITLSEDPMVRDGESTVVGETIELFRGERRAVVKRARITLPPLKDLGFPKNAPAPTDQAPAPAATPAPAKPQP